MVKGLRISTRAELETVARALADYLHSPAKMELLGYWSRHPGGWSSRRLLTCGSGFTRSDVEQALTELVKDGIVTCKDGKYLRFYALSLAHPARSTVLKLARLTPKQQRQLARPSRSTGLSGQTEDTRPQPAGQSSRLAFGRGA